MSNDALTYPIKTRRIECSDGSVVFQAWVDWRGWTLVEHAAPTYRLWPTAAAATTEHERGGRR